MKKLGKSVGFLKRNSRSVSSSNTSSNTSSSTSSSSRSSSASSSSPSWNWEKIVATLFDPGFRSKIHRAFGMGLLVVIFYNSGKFIAIFTASMIKTKQVKSVGRPILASGSGQIKKELDQILSSNLFNSFGGASAPSPVSTLAIDQSLNCQKAKRKSNLPLKLITTMVLQDSIKSLASVQVRSSRDILNIREGEQVKDIAQIGKINRKEIIIKNLKTGSCEYVKATEKKSSIRKEVKVLNPSVGKKLIDSKKKGDIINEGNKFRIKKSLIQKSVSNITEILTQALAVPIKNPDGTYVFKITEIVPGSIYSQLGIEDGDIITSFDGKKIKDVNEVVGVLGRLDRIDKMSLELKRNGEEKSFEYSIE